MTKVPMVDIYISGKKYLVPSTLTIMNAMEYAGFQLKRGCGCRAGFCGACATVYRIAGNNELKVGLACQTKVEANMFLAQIPFFPALKGIYNINNLPPTAASIALYYPEIYRCIGCGSCTKVCPQNINVMQYIAHAQRGEIAQCATKSFDCIMCGLCASRCPVHIVQYHVAILARRLYSRHLLPQASHLKQRVMEIKEGKYEAELRQLMKLSSDELRIIYNNRNIEE